MPLKVRKLQFCATASTRKDPRQQLMELTKIPLTKIISEVRDITNKSNNVVARLGMKTGYFKSTYFKLLLFT